MIAYIICIVFILISIHFCRPKTFHEAYFSKEQSTCVRGLLSVMVIFHHISQGMDLTIHHYPFFKMSGFLIVALFFFYSGYGLLFSLLHKKDYMKTFIQKRIPSIYIPFVSINFIYIVCQMFLYGTKYSIISFIKGVLGIQLVSGIFWYMWVLLLFYLVFYILFSSFSLKKAIWYLTFFVGAFIVTLATTKGIDNYWYISTPAFIAGIWFAHKEKEIVRFIQKNYVLTFVTLFIAVMICIMYILGIKIPFGNTIIWYLVNLGITVLLSFLLVTILLKCRLQSSLLSFLGNISLEIYLLHILWIDFFRNIGVADKSPLLYIFLVLECSIILAYLVHKWNQWLLHKITSKTQKKTQ